jgi:serine/threonine protein phosphatase PrpC
VRLNNEDCFFVTRLERRLLTLLTNVPAGHIPEQHAEIGYGFVVADGMGGEAGGEVASRTAICKLVELVLETHDWHMRLDREGANEVPGSPRPKIRKAQGSLDPARRY